MHAQVCAVDAAQVLDVEVSRFAKPNSRIVHQKLGDAEFHVAWQPQMPERDLIVIVENILLAEVLLADELAVDARDHTVGLG